MNPNINKNTNAYDQIIKYGPKFEWTYNYLQVDP